MKISKVYLASDHAGFPLKMGIIDYLKRNNIEFEDLGTDGIDSVDYPDYARKLALALKDDPSGLGIAICGSGNGICISMNKFPHIRGALCWNEELALLARAHNNANVLCLSGWFVPVYTAHKIVKVFLETEFEGGRHQRRVDKITQLINEQL
ncbi:MAG: ribose 5-phosphate isomerase B [Chlorobi bacterium]|nr:ribose 5-phosphate isomerase B [Chlorobiota bacterium]